MLFRLIILLLFGTGDNLIGRATAVPQFNTSACSASCTVDLPRVKSVVWNKVQASTHTTIAAFTVVTIINTQQNLTRYTTKTAQLPEGYTIPATNENGTRLCVLQGEKATDQPVTLPFPTFRISTNSIYSWDGQLYTTANNGTHSTCLSTSTLATWDNPPPITQYIPTDFPISHDPYGLNYECTSSFDFPDSIAATNDEGAFQSCRPEVPEFSYPSPTPLPTAAWLTVATSTSYEIHTSIWKGSNAPTSSWPISPAPHTTMALPTTTIRGPESSPFIVGGSHKESISTTRSTGPQVDTISSLELPTSGTSHPVIVSNYFVSSEPTQELQWSNVVLKISKPNTFATVDKTSGAPPPESAITSQPLLSSDEEPTAPFEPAVSQGPTVSANVGVTEPHSGVQGASKVTGRTTGTSPAEAGHDLNSVSSCLAESGIGGVTSSPVPIATTPFSTSIIYSTSLSTSVTTDDKGSTSEVVATRSVSLGITVIPITSTGIPVISAAAVSNPSPSVSISSGLQSATSAPTSVGEGSGFSAGGGGHTSVPATTDASSSETQTGTVASLTGVPTWNSASKSDHTTGYGLMFVWFGLLLAF